MSAATTRVASGEGSSDHAAASKINHLEQQLALSKKRMEVLEVEQSALVRCLEEVLLLASSFTLDVRDKLAAAGSHSPSIDDTTKRDNSEEPLSSSRKHAEPIESFLNAAVTHKAELAIYATQHTIETMGSLFPFLLRCVHSRGQQEATAEPQAVAAPVVPPPVNTIEALLSDDQVLSILENIEYDRRMKLMVRLFSDLLRKANAMWESQVFRFGQATPTKTAGEEFSTLLLDQTLSPVAIPLDEQHSSLTTFSTPPPLVVGNAIPQDRFVSHSYFDGTESRRQHEQRHLASLGGRGLVSASKHFGQSPPKQIPLDETVDVILPTASADVSIEDEALLFHNPNTTCHNSSQDHAYASGVSSISSEEDGDGDEDGRAKQSQRSPPRRMSRSSREPPPTTTAETKPNCSRSRRRLSFGFDVAEYSEIIDQPTMLERPLLRIIYVRDGTSADQAGIRAGDVLIKVNEWNVSTHLELEAATSCLQHEPYGTPVHLTVLRNGKARVCYFTPDEDSDVMFAPLTEVQQNRSVSPGTSASPQRRTPLRHDLLGSFIAETSPPPNHPNPDHTVSVMHVGSDGSYEALKHRSSLTVGPNHEHNVSHDASMLSKLNKTLDRLKELQRRREELQLEKAKRHHQQEPSSGHVDATHNITTTETDDSTAHSRTPRHLRYVSSPRSVSPGGVSPSRRSLGHSPYRGVSPSGHRPWK